MFLAAQRHMIPLYLEDFHGFRTADPALFEDRRWAAKGMCEETLDLHHGKHHQAYVTALNGFVEKDPALQGKSLDDIVKSTAAAGGPVFNNAGQHWNHIIFWQCMSPKGGIIPPKLEAKINEDLGGVADVQGRVQGGRRQPVRLRLGVAGAGLRRQAEGDEDPERLQPARHRRGQGAARLRCVGAQLLPGLPQSPPGLPAELAG